jgi:putative restriction endonuclease
VNFYVGVTDNKWFSFLSGHQPDEVNFWRPRATKVFRALRPGELFLFKLHRPQRYIVGGGFFVRQSFLPLSITWDVFKEKNGAASYGEFSALIRRHRGTTYESEPDPVIACIILTTPFFFHKEDWIAEPPDWSPNLVQGKRYTTNDVVGKCLWEQVHERMGQYLLPAENQKPLDSLNIDINERYGPGQIIRPRLGQGGFRVLVTEAYNRRCAITGERTLPVLQAAHIKPYSESGPHHISNGLLLRSDLHILFDRGLMTVTPDYRVEVSRRIRDEYENGKEYYRLSGKRLTVIPPTPADRPSTEFIEWHNQNVFAG